MDYKKLKNTWSGIRPYNLNGRANEAYAPAVTMSLPAWQRYVASGNNTLLGSGGVIPGGTVQTAGGMSGAVYAGHVRQGY